MKTDDRFIQPDAWDKYYTNNKKIINAFKLNDNLFYLWFESGKFFSKHINSKNNNLKFIELGCGGGNFLPYFNKKYDNFEIFGIDTSPEGCKIVFQRLNKVPPKNIMCEDILKKDFKTKYDITFSVGLIEHFDDPFIPLKKHVDILKKDGIMLLVIPNLTGLQGKILKSKIWYSKKDWEKKPKDWIFGGRDITIDKFEKWCKSAGLMDIKILPLGGFFPTLLFDSIEAKKKSKVGRVQILHRYTLLPIFILLNFPFLFRINSFTFSPYLIAVGRKE